jgi:alkylmercury lyase
MSTASSEMIEARSDLEQIIQAWENSKEGNYSPESVRASDFVLQSIASGNPVAAEELATNLGFGLKETQILMRKSKKSGADFDDEGRMIGNALTLRPTSHRLEIGGQTLYAWCALDTLFLPGLIGKTGEIYSTSAATGDPIRLTVAPTGVQQFNPASTVLSVVVPGTSQACEPDQKGGANGAACSSMNFFATREEAEEYLGADTDVSILTVEQASELAQRAWVVPYRSALDSASRIDAN